MKDIALVTHDFEKGGGAASMTAFLYEALQESASYQPDIVSLAHSSRDEASVRVRAPKTWGSGPQVVERTARGIDHLHVGTWFAKVEPLRYWPREVLDEVFSDYDLIQFVIGNPPWTYVAKNLDKPVFLWTATTLWEDRATRLEADTGARAQWRRAMTWWGQIYERKALRQADTVFAVSDYTRRNLNEQFSVKATLATQGVDVEHFCPVESPQEDYILTVSRINDPRKRIPLLLEAYSKAKKESGTIPDLYLVGDRPDEHIRQTARDLGVDDSVRFLGRQSQSELVELYQHALCFVLSSDEEGLGIVILEAMACGRPVVSTDSGGPGTLVTDGETGFLTPVGDSDTLGTKMVQLAENPDLRKAMGAAARQQTEERFSVESAKQPFLKAYEKYER